MDMFDVEVEKDMARKAKLKTYNSILQRIAKGGNYEKLGLLQTPPRFTSPSKLSAGSIHASSSKKTEVKHRFEAQVSPLRNKTPPISQMKTAEKSAPRASSPLVLNNVQVVEIKKVPLPPTSSKNKPVTPTKLPIKQDIKKTITPIKKPASKADTTIVRVEATKISPLKPKQQSVVKKVADRQPSKSPVSSKRIASTQSAKTSGQPNKQKTILTAGQKKARQAVAAEHMNDKLAAVIGKNRSSMLSQAWQALSMVRKLLSVKEKFADQFREASLLRRGMKLLESNVVYANKWKLVWRAASRNLCRAVVDSVQRQTARAFSDIRTGGLKRYIQMKTPQCSNGTTGRRTNFEIFEASTDGLFQTQDDHVARRLTLPDTPLTNKKPTPRRFNGRLSTDANADVDELDSMRSNLRSLFLFSSANKG